MNCTHCREPITCGHIDEHPGLCCDCFDLSVGMPLAALNRERAQRGAPLIRHEWPGQRIPRDAIRVDLPNVVQQRDHTCGAACIVALLAYYGIGTASEADVVAVMGFDERGSDPAHLVAAAARYGLRHEEYRPMSNRELRDCLDRRRPVVMMLQAWGERASYVDHWTDGHWVVAIGYDRRGVYFEDPSIECMRGFLAYDELDERWHDVDGPDDAHVERYGLALWLPRVRSSAHARRARSLG